MYDKERCKDKCADTTHLSTEQLQSMAQAASEAIICADESGSIIFWNSAAENIFGYSADEVLGEPFTVVLPVRTRKISEIIFRRLAADNFTGVHGKIYEFKGLRKNGSSFPVEISLARWESGKSFSVAGILRDITHRKQVDKELRDSVQKYRRLFHNARDGILETKLESVGVLAGGIAHDFNNILTVILGNISIARAQAANDDKICKKLVEIEKAAMHAIDLTRQLLSFAKGGIPTSRTVTCIRGLIKEVTAFALSGTNVLCFYDLQDDLWQVKIDESQIRQVINNLIINSLQAMPSGGAVTVNARNMIAPADGVECTDTLAPGRYIAVSVKDEGFGIPEENLIKIFDPYFTTKPGGTGLGMTTTYSIIKKHQGHITVSSKPGKGTTVVIYLPAATGRLQSKEDELKPLPGGKGRILVMDDDAKVREVLGEMLLLLGYDADLTTDGAEALKLYVRAQESCRPYDAVILDLTVPGGMGGRDTVRELMKITPHVKTIASSGYCSEEVASDFSQAGFSAFIAKPYQIEELGEVLHSLVM
jgi:two-component system, cell cycle sensor histidine kinase and response regulator CckA